MYERYECQTCGHQGEYEFAKEDGGTGTTLCAECGSDDLKPMTKCEICGEWFVDDDLYDICAECTEDIHKAISKLIDDLEEKDGAERHTIVYQIAEFMDHEYF